MQWGLPKIVLKPCLNYASKLAKSLHGHRLKLNIFWLKQNLIALQIIYTTKENYKHVNNKDTKFRKISEITMQLENVSVKSSQDRFWENYMCKTAAFN